MIETGTTLQQRYKIDKQIGQGGMGAVYVATDARFGSTVAIKETLCMDDNFRKAIEREARLLNSLKHSALPRVSDHFEENNGMFLVMEYIPGDDVAAMLEDPNVKFSVEQVLKWADQLLDALDYLHNQSLPVIHRDIKPQNLKINSRGEMILLDFGLAKGNPTDAGHHTAAKSIFGYSKNYASLEQIQGTGTDPRSDLYSLAATLYHLLTRVPPDDALTRAMSVLSQKPDPLAPASALSPEVPRGVAGVLQKAMDLNASERPSAASEMRQMLRESDKYAYLAEGATFAGNLTDAQVFAQPTRLMAEATIPVFASHDAKTEVFPTQDSQLTSVRSSDPERETNVVPASLTSAPPPKRRSFGMAAGALMMLLVGAAAAGGVYLVKPSLFGSSRTAQEPARPEVPVAAQPVADTTALANAGSEANTAPSVSAETTGEPNAVKAVPNDARPAITDKPTETAKTTAKAAPAAKDKDVNGNDVIDLTVDDPEIPRGMVLTERDENGVTRTIRINPPKPAPGAQPLPPNMGRPVFPNIDVSKLTPAQRQKLMRVWRNTQMRQQQQAPPQPIKPDQPN